MWNYLFEVIDEDSDACGEIFFVQSDGDREDAEEIALDVVNYAELCYCGRYTDEEAEEMGYDTY